MSEDLFSLAAARSARDSGIQRADEHANEAWREAALNCVYWVALERETFVSDDVEKLLQKMPVSTHEKRALGAVMLKARKKGWIASTGIYVPSSQKQCHCNTVTLWRSRIFQKPL